MANAERDIWAKVSVNYFDHPKIDALTDPAQLLHLSLILLAKKQQLNGILSARACKKRGDGTLDELIESGLVTRIPDGYRLEDVGEFRKVSRLGNIWESSSVRTRAAIPAELRMAVYRRDGYQCVTCGATRPLSLDRIFPWSLGGQDIYENLQTMCRSCNSRKGAKVGEGHAAVYHGHQ